MEDGGLVIDNYAHLDALWLTWWAVGGACGALGFAMSLRELRRLRSLGTRARVGGIVLPPITRCVMAMVLQLPVFALASTVTLFVPDLAVVLQFVSASVQAFSFTGFWGYTIGLLDGPSGAVRILGDLPASRLWRERPCCCLWGVYYGRGEQKVTAQALTRIRRGALQFCVLSPLLAFMDVAVEGRVPADSVRAVRNVVSVLYLFSAMTCVYHMRVLRRVAAPVLKTYRLAHKFGLMRLSILLPKLLTFLLRVFLRPYDMGPNGDALTGYTHAEMWSAFVVAVLSVPMALAVRRVFPSSECSPRPVSSPGPGAESADVEMAAVSADRLWTQYCCVCGGTDLQPGPAPDAVSCNGCGAAGMPLHVERGPEGAGTSEGAGGSPDSV